MDAEVAAQISRFLTRHEGADEPLRLREPRENPFSVTARRSSAKAGRLVHAESLLEYDFFNVLDFDPRVVRYEEQCVSVKFKPTAQARLRRYVADVAVQFRQPPEVQAHGRHQPGSASPTARLLPIATVYEVKPMALLKENWSDLRPRYKAMVAALKGSGVTFRLVTDRCLDRTFLANVRFLVPYAHPAASGESSPVLDQLDTWLDDLRLQLSEPTTPRRIVMEHSGGQEHRPLLIGRIWRMLATGKLEADLLEPLAMDTPLWPGGPLAVGQASFPDPKWRTPPHDWRR